MFTQIKRHKINSLLVAAVIAETNICVIISVFVNIPMISVLLMMGILISFFYIDKKYLYISSGAFYAYGIFAFVLIVSMLINGMEIAGQRMLYFLTFGTTAMIAVNTKYDLNIVIKYLMYVYGINLLVYFLFQRNSVLSSDDFWSDQMGVAYGFVPPFILSVICILNNKNANLIYSFGKHRLFILGLSILIFIFSAKVILFDCGTRGAIVTGLIALSFLFINRLSKWQKICFSIIILCMVIFLMINWESILYTFLGHSSGGDVRALAKLSQMSERGDASNGRDGIYMQAFQMIKNNPIFGYGVGYFENQTHTVYVHQFILDSFLTWGLIGSILFFYPIVKYIQKTRYEHNKIKYSFNIFILSICFIPLMFSNSFWLYPTFWFGYFYAMSQKVNHIKKQNDI